MTNQRARIIVATAELVAEFGYEGTTPRAIAGRAGVSTKTFYELYADKQAAFLAGYTLLDGIVMQIIRTPVDLTDPRRAIRDITAAFLRQLADAPLFTRIRIVEGRAAGPVALQRRTEIYEAMVDAFTVAIDGLAEDDPALRPPGRDVLMILVAGIGGLVLQQVVAHGPEALPALQPAIVDAIERVVLPEPPGDTAD